MSLLGNANITDAQIRNFLANNSDPKAIRDAKRVHGVTQAQIDNAMKQPAAQTGLLNTQPQNQSLYTDHRANILYGGGNANISSRDIQNFIGQGKSPDEIYNEALRRGVSADQIKQAMTGTQYTAPAIDRFIANQGVRRDVITPAATVDPRVTNQNVNFNPAWSSWEDLKLPTPEPVEAPAAVAAPAAIATREELNLPVYQQAPVTNANRARSGEVANVLNQVTDPNSVLMQRAASMGNQQANRRGLLNSSIGISSAQNAIVDAGLQIASRDADSSNQFSLRNAENANLMSRFNAEQGLKSGMFGSDLMAQQSRFNAEQGLKAGIFNSEQGLKAGMFNSEQGLKAGMFGSELMAHQSRFNSEYGLRAQEFNAEMLSKNEQFNVGQINTLLRDQLSHQQQSRMTELEIAYKQGSDISAQNNRTWNTGFAEIGRILTSDLTEGGKQSAINNIMDYLGQALDVTNAVAGSGLSLSLGGDVAGDAAGDAAGGAAGDAATAADGTPITDPAGNPVSPGISPITGEKIGPTGMGTFVLGTGQKITTEAVEALRSVHGVDAARVIIMPRRAAPKQHQVTFGFMSPAGRKEQEAINAKFPSKKELDAAIAAKQVFHLPTNQEGFFYHPGLEGIGVGTNQLYFDPDNVLGLWA